MSYQLSRKDAIDLGKALEGETNPQTVQQVQAWISTHQEPNKLQDPDLVNLEDIVKNADGKGPLIDWLREFKARTTASTNPAESKSVDHAKDVDLSKRLKMDSHPDPGFNQGVKNQEQQKTASLSSPTNSVPPAKGTKGVL